MHTSKYVVNKTVAMFISAAKNSIHIILNSARVLRGACSQTHNQKSCSVHAHTVLGDVRESGITGLPLVGWKSKSYGQMIFIYLFFFHISTVDSVMIIRLCNFSLEQGKNDLTTVISTDDF